MTTYLDDCVESLRIASEQLGHAATALAAYGEDEEDIESEVIEEIHRTQQVVANLRSWVESLEDRT